MDRVWGEGFIKSKVRKRRTRVHLRPCSCHHVPCSQCWRGRCRRADHLGAVEPVKNLALIAWLQLSYWEGYSCCAGSEPMKFF